MFARTRWFCLLVVLAGAGWAAGGCLRDTRLAGRKLRHPEVRTVTRYGVTLDQEATPQQVAYVVLRALRNDVRAPDRAEREAALDVQFDVCAANRIAEANVWQLKRNEYIYNVVDRWAPTVAHYVDDFETQWEAARGRLVLRGLTESADQCAVLLEVDDPSGDPAAGVVLVVWLVQDHGYWRVTHLGFDPSRRSLVQDG